MFELEAGRVVDKYRPSRTVRRCTSRKAGIYANLGLYKFFGSSEVSLSPTMQV